MYVLAWTDVDYGDTLRHYVAWADEDGEPVGDNWLICSSAQDAIDAAFEMAKGAIVESDLIWD